MIASNPLFFKCQLSSPFICFFKFFLQFPSFFSINLLTKFINYNSQFIIIFLKCFQTLLLIIIMLRKLLTSYFPTITTSRYNDTIYALATGVGTAVSVIRVGGENAHRALEILNKTKDNSIKISKKQLLQRHKIEPRKAHLKRIYNTEGNIIDQGLILYFPAPLSYNSEQIIQFHIHGSKAVVASIFKQLKNKGFRMADRGQFTKRALMNGKMDLVEAQSVDDLIKSESEFERQVAINNMLGKSKQFLDEIKTQLIKCLANNEAFIDFQDDEADVKADLLDSTKQIVKDILANIQKILQNYENLQAIKNGIDIAITGKPNTGKSTIINALSRKQVAIVSEQPGTTRDILQSQIECSGVVVNLYDTAGLRQTLNKIQIEGIKRAKQKAKQSQVRLLIIDLNQELTQSHVGSDGASQIQIINKGGQDEVNYNEIIDRNTIIIINKSDTLPQNLKQNAKYFIVTTKKTAVGNQQAQGPSSQTAEYTISNERHQISMIISSHNPAQIQKLQQYISEVIKKKYSLYSSQNTEIYFTRQRYFQKLIKCKSLLQLYVQQNRPDITCQYLRQAIQEISQMFGKVDVEDVLDVLFRDFCIGK